MIKALRGERELSTKGKSFAGQDSELWKFILVSAVINAIVLLFMGSALTRRAPGTLIEVSLFDLALKSRQQKPKVSKAMLRLKYFQEKLNEILPFQQEALSQAQEQQDPAKEENAQQEPSLSQNGVMEGPGSGKALLDYRGLVRRQIEAQGMYPPRAFNKYIEGTVFVKFAISPDGNASEIQVLRSSGSIILDEKAVTMVEKASPFPKFQEDSPRYFSLPITFKLDK